MVLKVRNSVSLLSPREEGGLQRSSLQGAVQLGVTEQERQAGLSNLRELFCPFATSVYLFIDFNVRPNRVKPWVLSFWSQALWDTAFVPKLWLCLSKPV